VLLLNVHFHTMALDCVYIANERGELLFKRVAPPKDAEVARIAEKVCRRVGRLLERRSLSPQGVPCDEVSKLWTCHRNLLRRPCRVARRPDEFVDDAGRPPARHAG